MRNEERKFTTVEESGEINAKLKKQFSGRLVNGFTYGACDTILGYGNHGRMYFYVQGLTTEQGNALVEELRKKYGKHVEHEFRNKNGKYHNLIINPVYREVFDGPLVQEWVENCLGIATIIKKHGGWLMRGHTPDKKIAHHREYHEAYIKQMKELDFPMWK